jgi:NAD(P)H-hydrate epimerase
MRALSREDLRRIDRYAIETLGVPGAVLMENAGRNAADAIERFLGGAASKKVAIVAGAGNNGGDGFVVARHLAMRGAIVTTFLLAPQDRVLGDAAVNLTILRNLREVSKRNQPRLEASADITVVTGRVPKRKIPRLGAPPDLARLAETLRQFDLVVDAVGGTGISGPLRGELATAVRQINAAGRPVVAIDIPTGLDCDTGQAHDPTVRAALTVTFVAPKLGFDAPSAPAYTGKVIVADIGIPAEIVAELAGR